MTNRPYRPNLSSFVLARCFPGFTERTEGSVEMMKNASGLKWLMLLSLWTSILLMPQRDLCGGEDQSGPVKVKVDWFFDPNTPESPDTRNLLDFMKLNRDIEVEEWGGIKLPGGTYAAKRSSLMMAIAGGTAPDIGSSWFHTIRTESESGFLHPLNEWIGTDQNGNGQIDDHEAKWAPWKNINSLLRRVATHEGKVYGIPTATKGDFIVIYRIDHVREAGLDPNNPPQTWSELKRWCQKCTSRGVDPKNDNISPQKRGISIQPYGFTILPWISAAGGDPVVQIKTSTLTGEEYTFPQDEVDFISAAGEDLKVAPTRWETNFSSPQALAAVELYRDILYEKWIIDPISGEPVALREEDIARGKVKVQDEWITFLPDQVITGYGYAQMEPQDEDSAYKTNYFKNGEVSMMLSTTRYLTTLAEESSIDPNQISWFPFPKSELKNSERVMMLSQYYAVMYEGISKRSKEEQQAAWKTMTAIVDEKVRDREAIDKILKGFPQFVAPDDLERLGYADYLKYIPKVIARNYAELASGEIKTIREPYSGFWMTIDQTLKREVLSPLLTKGGDRFDYKSALKEVDRKANSGLMFAMSEEELQSYRPTARVVLTLAMVFIALLVVKLLRQWIKEKPDQAKKGSKAGVYNKWLAWGMVLPALILIAIWSYYPLLKGMIMAFQEYRITGESDFVGLDNFIILALDSSFWWSLVRTMYFVVLNMIFCFITPIILAVLLTDIPRGKIFFRTLFFLPQMTSGLVIALLWKMMYEPTSQGFFNQLIGYLNWLPGIEIEPQLWLQDPSLAMICCILPSMWASMGMSSLIYLAALGSVPKELYEAAEMDGAGLLKKMFHITLPTLLPLIVINFVGAFIASFQNMGNIFLLTFGGPGESTTVIGLKIWMEAYANLRFSMATTMAWFLGAILIGFTYFQIKFLNKIEYRKAKG